MHTNPVDSGQWVSRHLEDKGYVLTLLGRLIQHRVLVQITLPNNPQTYTSTVLSLDVEQNTLLLDQIFPAVQREQLSADGLCELHARVEGASLSCQLRLQGIDEGSGLVCYRMQLPEAVAYTQRREGHRVRVDSLGVVAEIYSDNGMACKGILHDFSPGGVSLELEDDRWFRSTEVYRCTLYLPHEPPFHCKLEICCRRHDAAKDRQILGGSFVELDKRGENTVSKLVTELERQLLRSRRMPQTEDAANRQ